MDLFESQALKESFPERPLADRMRPATLDEIVGQEHLTAQGSILRQAIEADRVFSMILWGPPGCGKTTLAGIIASETESEFVEISAVLSGVKDIRRVIESAREKRSLFRRRTLLFVDEIHRFNKAQQDAFLPHVENGLITLVGATTENPSFEVIPALVSRCRVFTLKSLEKPGLVLIMKRALNDREKGLGIGESVVSDDVLEYIAAMSDGDARIALSGLETIVMNFSDRKHIELSDAEKLFEKKALLYDKAGEEHYNLISAFIKSMRGSDPDAAAYWLERMLAAGEDPCYLIRRMIRFATEDIGMADPGALTMALNAGESFRILGRPEGDDGLFQAAVYLATAPKSNSIYMMHKQLKKQVAEHGSLPVPLHIRNAPTALMKSLDYGRGYKYAHDYENAFVPQSFLPEKMEGTRFYFPSDRGYEKTVKHRLDAWLDLKRKKTEK